MCGIIGYYSDDTTLDDIEVLKKVMTESRIRGKHASGIAWYDGIKINSFVKPIPIDLLVKRFDFKSLIYNKRVSMIAHARYSTSDIRYNQPIVSCNMAIAHNGVISQAAYENWESLYGYKCDSRNDSELLLKAIDNKENIIKKFPDASIAAVLLTDTGQVKYFRNERRPIWTGTVGKGTIIASTYDILHRSGVINICKVEAPNDLQRRDITQWKA